MIVCICHAVSEKTIRESVSNGSSSLEELASTCGAGTVCGSCIPMISQMLSENTSENFPMRACSDCPKKAFDISSPFLLASGETV